MSKSQYDEVTEFDARKGQFICRYCGGHLRAEQGYFAEPGTPEANFATALICDRCGHALDPIVAAETVWETPRRQRRLYSIRYAAMLAVEELIQQFDEYHAAYYAIWLEAMEREMAAQFDRQAHVARAIAEFLEVERRMGRFTEPTPWQPYHYQPMTEVQMSLWG